MSASGNTLFDQAYKKYYEKEKKTKTIELLELRYNNKSAILLSFYKVARPQTFLIFDN